MTGTWTGDAAAEIAAELDRMVASGRTPGGVVVAGDAGGAETSMAGAVIPSGAPAGPGTFYDIASLTKVVATWPLVGRAAARGLLDLDAPVAAHFPGGPYQAGEVTARQILTHTAGLMPSTRLDHYLGAEGDIAESILSEPITPPGPHHYINRGFILLGLLLERVEGVAFDVLLDRYAASIGTEGVTFGPMRRGSAVAPTERRIPGAHPTWGVVHDENAALLGGIAGHAGVFATAEALSTYARVLLAEHVGAGAFGDYVRESWEPHVRIDETADRGLAWLISDTGLVYHHGFTGTSLYLHPPTARYLVLLSNPIHQGRQRHGLAELRAVARKLFT